MLFCYIATEAKGADISKLSNFSHRLFLTFAFWTFALRVRYASLRSGDG